ncbi:MAG TPA: hypothetical protein VN704_01550 [Verrucomicrobiae bacterium]|nr:hypothetical protein [Verrucomicrobiae bacterium]
MQTNTNNFSDKNKRNDTNSNGFIDEDSFKSIVDKFFKQMTDLQSITTFGPFTSLINDPTINIKVLKDHGNLLIRYQTSLNYYLSSMINAYFEALNKISSSSITEKITNDEYRKLILNTFEDVFSTMFESPEFSIIYNNLANSLIDLTKSYQKFFDNQVLFKQSQQQFSKEEKDLLFYSLYEIKKLSMEIKKKLNEEK